MNAARCLCALGLLAVFGCAREVPMKPLPDVCPHAGVHLDVTLPGTPCPVDKADLRIRLHNC